MEQFVYTVSHDLKSPLVTSTGFLGLLKEDLAMNRLEQVQIQSQRLERANARMNQLITDLFTIKSRGECEPKLKVDVANVVKLICENLAEQIKENQFKWLCMEPIPMISADKKIYQVLKIC